MKFLKNATTLEFTMVLTHTLVFLIMYEKLQNVTKATTLKTLDFTRLKGTFEENFMFSYMVYNEKLKMLLFRKSLKPLILLSYKHIF